MSAHRRITAGAVLLTAGIVIGCLQSWLAVTGRAPVVSGLSLLALALGGVGAWLMVTSCDVEEPGDDEEAVLAQAARIVDGAVADEAEAVVDRIHGQPHSHLRMVLTPEDGPDGDDPEMLCELVAPRGAMGLAVGTLAQLMHDPHHVAEILEHLASGGDRSAAGVLEHLTSDGGEW